MEYIVLASAIFILIALLMGKEYLNVRNFRKMSLEKLYQDYGTFSERSYKSGEMEHIQKYYLRHPKKYQIDDITWNDLNLDSIYQKMNTACSATGDEYLYYRLRTPIYDHAEMDKWESQIKFFMEHEEERRSVQSLFFNMGRMGRYSLYEYIDNLDVLGERNNRKYILNNLMLIICIGIMFVSLPAGTIALIIMLCHNIIGYFKEYKRIEPYVTSFRYINKLLNAVDKMSQKTISGIAEEQDHLKEYHRRMKGFIRNAYLISYVEKGNGDPFSILFDYLRMAFYIDLIQFNNALRALRGHLTEIDEMVTILGRIEVAVVIGSYRNCLEGEYCIPNIQYDGNEGRYLKIEQVYHPIMTNPVKNSVSAEKGVLLTGSNASGKSTFLRAVAVNALLAQTIHTCLADCYEAPVFRIYSSMALKDDLLSGESYYMVEIKSIKRILDQVQRAKKENGYVLCFVDEVLRGTNTVERIAASTQIMKMLASDHSLCFAATHDVELTKLLKKEFDNYHFEERIEEDDIFFPYKLMKGPATTRNAIALLKMLGYDEQIIEEAETMAQNFLKDGKWQDVESI